VDVLVSPSLIVRMVCGYPRLYVPEVHTVSVDVKQNLKKTEGYDVTTILGIEASKSNEEGSQRSNRGRITTDGLQQPWLTQNSGPTPYFNTLTRPASPRVSVWPTSLSYFQLESRRLKCLLLSCTG